MSVYLDRYAVQDKYLTPDQYGDPGIVVVIPCHKEEGLIESLESLERCALPVGSVSVIIVINASQIASEEVKQFNRRTYEEAIEWSRAQRNLRYHFILENELPKKHAGVGLARKIGMDEAIRIFESNDRDGVILCFDADSRCDGDLLVEVEKIFQNPRVPGCSIYYEHPTEGSLGEEVYTGIIQYELHLRYYIDALNYAGFPHAYQTIGSSMAVRSSVYQKQGGMNRRQAGEDFYFLHRLISLGNFKNLNTTRIIPSPRKSDRVPFGTGKAIGDWLDSDQGEMSTYDPKSFEELKSFFGGVSGYFKLESHDMGSAYESLSPCLKSFVSFEEFESKIAETNQHSTSLKTFEKRFFQWFDAFKVLKFVHHARDEFHPNVKISEAGDWLLEKLKLNAENLSMLERLEMIRKVDREENYSNLVASSPRM